MKIISGLIYHESNTFNPLPTGFDQFVELRGRESVERLASTIIFEDNGIEVIPSIYAMALSSGVVAREVYEAYKAELLTVVQANPDADAIWLHLHGAMLVEEIGCAEVDLLRAIRQFTGDDLPIALTLDPHGNITKELTELATIIRAYRTIPHIDQPETEARTARELIELMQAERGSIGYTSIPLALSGETALSDEYPLNAIIERLDEYERMEGILDASFFVGFAWADVPWNSASALVVPKSAEYNELAQTLADEISEYVLSVAHEFKFQMPVVDIPGTIDRINSVQTPGLIVADSGDNTTGGAVGANTVLLREVLQGVDQKRVLITTVFDPDAVKHLEPVEIGDEVALRIGMNLSDESAPVKFEGTLQSKGSLLGYMSSERDAVGKAYLVAGRNVDVIVTDISGSFVTPNHFVAAGARYEDYDAVILKQGYLFPKLSAIATDYFMSLTPGGTYQLLHELKYDHTSVPAKRYSQEV